MKSEDNELPFPHKSDTESYFSLIHSVNCLHLASLRLNFVITLLMSPHEGSEEEYK
jgi:hypothetical protein